MKKNMRYNEDKQLLELVFEGEVIDSIGVSKENYNEEYKDIWEQELQEELKYLLKEFDI